MKAESNTSLLFLLGLAPLAIGCIITTDDGDTDANGTTDDTSGGAATDTGDPPGMTGMGDSTTTGDATTDATTVGPMDTTAGSSTGAADDTTTTGMDTTSTGMDGTASSGPDVSSSSDGGTDSSESTAGTGTMDLCAEYGALVAYCYAEEEGLAAETYCNDLVDYLAKYGEDCTSAFEDYMACLNALTCKEFMGVNACEAEFDTFDAACF